MDRDLLSHLPVVLAVARRGGFAAAATELNMSPSNVSHIVKLVEDRIGLPLFARTTRSVALTDAGRAFTSAAGAAFAELQSAWEQAGAYTGKPSGLLRINAPRLTLGWVLLPVIRELSVAYPDIQVEVFCDDGISDIVTGGFDAGVRLGGMVAQDMVVVRLASAFRVMLAASPTYLKARGIPGSIDDLASHACIQYRMTSAGNVYEWELSSGGETVKVKTNGPVIVNDMLQALAFARAGLGICYTFEPIAGPDLESGALVEILPDASITEDGLSLYYPKRASLAPKLRAFIDTARRLLAK